MRTLKLRGGALGVGFLAVATPAFAGGLSDNPGVAISAERLSMLSRTSISGDVETDITSLALFARHNSASPFEYPRFAVDGFVASHLTIGGSFSYGSYSSDAVELDYFTLQPRVGYVLRLGNSVDFWLKGGVSYYSSGVDNGSDASGLGLSGAFDFVFEVAPHFGISLGPSFDLGLIGEQTNPAGVDSDVKYTTLALNVGLVGWL